MENKCEHKWYKLIFEYQPRYGDYYICLMCGRNKFVGNGNYPAIGSKEENGIDFQMGNGLLGVE